MRILTSIAFLFSVAIYSQNIRTDLPVNSPQSPTTSDLGKYGEIQVNESTGSISPSIPLFDYNAGDITIPIVLQYSGNGVRVNQDPTWAGINWNINPGGIITREVNDLPDEKTYINNREYYPYSELVSLQGSNNPHNHTSQSYHKLKELTSQAVDSEVDIFNYNFMGYSGSFFLDKSNNVHLIKYDKELKILFHLLPENKSQIEIYTPDGTAYYFGVEASESSRAFLGIGAGSTANIPYTQNAFYLYKIKCSNGGLIDFKYKSYGLPCNYKKIGIKETAAMSEILPCNKSKLILYNDTERMVKLTKITNSINNQSIEFQSTERGNCNGLLRLEKIIIKNDSTVFKKIELNYLTINNESTNSNIGSVNLDNKFFLTKVAFFDKVGLFEKNYKLSYFHPESFPSKSSFAQDELGFYNGEISNTTLLPKSKSPVFDIFCLFETAKREAVFDFAKIGSLTKIEYPTGGYTEFEYELPYKGKETTFVDHFFSAYYRDPDYSFYTSPSEPNPDGNPSVGTSYYSILRPNEIDSDTEQARLTIPETTDITLKLSIHAIGAFTQHNNVKIKIIKITPGGQEIVWTSGYQGYGFNIGNNGNNVNNNYYIPYTKTLEPGMYIFKLSINLYAIDPSNSSVIARVQVGLPTGKRNLYYPGLRIKKVLTFDNNSNVETKNYFYNSLNNIDIESFIYTPNYISKSEVFNPQTNLFINQINLSANNIRNNFQNGAGSYTYEFVTVSYGNNFENGGKQMKFKKINDLEARYYSYVYDDYWPGGEGNLPLNYLGISDQIREEISGFLNVGTNHSYENSVPIEEIYFKNDKTKVKKTVFNYTGNLDTTISNIKIYPYCSTINANAFVLYDTNSYKYRLNSTETTEYYGNNSNDSIVSKKMYSYNSDKVSLPKSIETINSKLENTKTNIYYPSDVALLNNLLSQDISNLNLLQVKYNIAEIVKTESFVQNVLLGTKQVFFKDWGGKIFPHIVKTSKGSGQLEDKIIFHEYSSVNNPSLVSLKDGILIKYVYNIRKQVILKIENYNPSYEIGDNISIVQDMCFYQNNFPNSIVTKYNYDPVTNNLISIVDPKCDVFFYEYDSSNRLQTIKDKSGNILSENQYNYKPN